MACTWISSEEVREALGRPTETGEMPWGGYTLELATSAANEYAYTQRAADGKIDDTIVCPSPEVRLGTVMYAVRLYQQAGSGDTAVGFDGSSPLPSLSTIRANLGLARVRIA